MKAKDVMTTKGVTVGPDMPVNAIAALFLERHISAVPVIDDDRRILGIVSEGDLMRRGETERRPSWWLAAFSNAEELAREFTKARGQRAKDVMTREVLTVTEETPIAAIAELLEKRRIKGGPASDEYRGGPGDRPSRGSGALRGRAAGPTRGRRDVPRSPGRRGPPEPLAHATGHPVTKRRNQQGKRTSRGG